MRILSIGFVLMSCMLIIGCESDLLQTVPDDRVSEEIFWETERDAEFAANALYPTLDGVNIIAYDGITDVVQTNRPFSANLEIQRGRTNSDAGRFLSEWNSSYEAIRRANDFMDNIDGVDTDDEDLINQLKGEVITIRAYHYIKLAMLYGDVPLITTGIDIEDGQNESRTPVEEIWDFIETELDQAASWLPLNNGSRISRGVANGLKARAMLYAGRYSEAVESANKVMESDIYDLYPDYYELFQYEGEGNDEIILDRQYASGTNSHNIYGVLAPWSQISGSNGSQYVPTAKLEEMYDMVNGSEIDDPDSGYDPHNPYEDRDPRLRASMFLNGVTELPDGTIFESAPNSDGEDIIGRTVYVTTTGYNIRKYVANEDIDDPTNSGLNIILMRYAEVLLTYAEAKIELNEIDQSVYDAINEVRGRPSVDMPEITAAEVSSQEELRGIVRKERTIELAFEGFRLFDIRRWEIAEDVMPGTPKGITYTDDNGELRQVELSGEYERDFDPEKDYLWPIPNRERELNDNLTQNPGW